MATTSTRFITPSLVLASAALVLSSTATGYAVTKYTGKDIASNAVTSTTVKDGSLKPADVLKDTVAAMAAKGAVGDVGARGPAGTPGDTGIVGDQGPVGDKGATGLQGAPGPQGVIGDTGATGPTGIKGLQVVSQTGSVNSGTKTTVFLGCDQLGKVLLGWAFGPAVNHDDLRAAPKYVYNASTNLPEKVGIRIQNNGAKNDFTLMALCATRS